MSRPVLTPFAHMLVLASAKLLLSMAVQYMIAR